MLRPTAPAFSPPGEANGDGYALRPGGLGNPEVAAVNDMLDRLTIATKQESAVSSKAPPAKPAAAPAPAPSAPKPAVTGGIKILGKAQAPAATAPAAAKPSWPPVGGAPAAKAPSGGRDGVARELADYVKSRGVRVLSVREAGTGLFVCMHAYVRVSVG